MVNDVDFTGRVKTLGKSISALRISDLVAEGEKGVWLDLVPDTDTRQDVGVSAPQILLRGKLFKLRVDPHLIEEYCSSSYGQILEKQLSTQSMAQQRSLSALEEPKSPEIDSAPVGCFGFSSVIDCSLVFDTHDSHIDTGAVCILICEVFGGNVPTALGEPSELSLKVSFGEASDSQRCKSVTSYDDNEPPMTEKMRQSIQRLATLGLPAEVIAQSLGEDVLDVSRIMRKSGWNLNCPQKLFLFLRIGDLCSGEVSQSSDVHISVLRGTKGKVIAAGSVPIEHIWRASFSKYASLVNCSARDAVVALDLQFRMYALSESILTAPRHSGLSARSLKGKCSL